MSFTIVVPFFNGHQYLSDLLASIPDGIQVIIVDDQSDGLPNVGRPNTQVLRLQEKGYFTGAVNAGIEACKNDVLVLNQDTYFTGDSWLNFIKQKKKKYALFGEQAGSHPAWPKRYIHGTFMYIRRDVIRKIGSLDAVNYPHWGSTCEYQLRACRNGFKALPVEAIPDFVHLRSEREHFGSATKQVLASGKKGLLIRTPPQISVIIACYNHGKYLQDTVNSLIGGRTSLGKTKGQTRQDFEIIIVDDGSEDNSLEIIEKLADPWKGIHYVYQHNRGSAVAANTGIEASHARSGHFIAPLDADDMMEPERLDRMVQTYLANPHSVVYDNIRYFAHGQKGLVNWETGERYDVLDLGGYDFERVLYKNTLHKGLLYPKVAWEEAGGYPAMMNKGREDWAFNVALGINGWCGINTGEFEYLYRREGQNRTLRNTTPRWRAIFLSQLKQLFPNIYAGERPMGCCGGGSKNKAKNVKPKAAKTPAPLPGAKAGMVLLEYNGKNFGDETWRGPATKAIYVLGGVTRQQYVDVEDAGSRNNSESMLGWQEKDKWVFNLVKPPKPKPKPKDEIIEPKILDPREMKIKVLKDDLSEGSYSEIEINHAIELEKTGKNRRGAIRILEAALG